MVIPQDVSQTQPEKGLFKHPRGGSDLSELTNELNNVSTRIRILEERYTNLRRKTQVGEQNMLTSNRNFNTEIKTLNSEINEIRREVDLIKNKIKQIIIELGNFAKKDNVKVLEKYINMLDPVKYVTENQVENIVRRILEENK